MTNSLNNLYKINIDKITKLGIPEIELRILLCDINHIDNMSDYFLRKEEEIKDFDLFNKNLKKLISGEPVQYIINKAYFMGDEYYVDNNVLIPRMETEEVVNFTTKKIKERFNDNAKVIDLCTGSGCIAISIKKHTSSQVFGSDIDEKCIEIAKKNSTLLNACVDFCVSDLLEYPIKNNMKFDVLVSNPPYIINKDEIDARTRLFEPLKALYPNEDVYDFYKKILTQSKQVLNDDSIIVMEIGYDMKDRLEVIAKEMYPSKTIEFIKDINGNYRIMYIG